MKKAKLGSNTVLFLYVLTSSAGAIEEEPFVDKLLGSPLLALASIIVINIIAFIYHKIRR